MHRLCHLGRVVACQGCNSGLKWPSGHLRKPRLHHSRTPATPFVTWEVERGAERRRAVRVQTWQYPRSGLIGGTEGVLRCPKVALRAGLGSDLERARLERRPLRL